MSVCVNPYAKIFVNKIQNCSQQNQCNLGVAGCQTDEDCLGFLKCFDSKARNFTENIIVDKIVRMSNASKYCLKQRYLADGGGAGYLRTLKK